MWLLFAFIAVPMIEIALFIQVGGAIGLGWTLLIVLLTAIVGSVMVRAQGMQELQNLQRSFSELRDPTETLASGAMILFSGALLLTPGFFTDVVGLALLVPAVRRAVFQWLRSRVKVNSFTMGEAQQSSTPQDSVIDGDFEEIDPKKQSTHRPSGWTQH